MNIPISHDDLEIDGTKYRLGHLSAISTVVPNKGRDGKSDLTILVRFSNHVCSERALHGQQSNMADHRGTRRVFDLARYTFSLSLPETLRQAIQNNGLCFVSKDYGGHKNLMMIEDKSGVAWSIVFCFTPLLAGVSMDILSVHQRDMRGKPKKNSLIYFARQCLIKQERVPKN